jgi:hypothetical protein
LSNDVGLDAPDQAAKHTCAHIEEEVASGNAHFAGRHYYNAIFSSAEKDRILSLLKEFDVGLPSSPRIDSQLSFSKPTTQEYRDQLLNFEHACLPQMGRSPSDIEDLLRLYRARPTSP